VTGSGVDAGLPLDAHLHTELSHDAHVPIDVYAALALERGVGELAVTDHLDFGPGWPSSASQYARRERYVRDAAERWAAHDLVIHFGVEITYRRVDEPAIREHLADSAYDYTIGSVHVGPDSPYRPAHLDAWLAGRDLAEVVAPYYEEVVAAARSGLFDTLGHLDFVKRYLAPRIAPATLAAAPELLEPVLAAVVEAGAALEVNTSGLRQPPAETYPAAWAVARFRELGGRRVVTGSDAHRAEVFGHGLADGYRLLAEAGFDEVVLRQRRRGVPGRAPSVTAAGAAGPST
jgi:histidinol-phosphatase (PHP family)